VQHETYTILKRNLRGRNLTGRIKGRGERIGKGEEDGSVIQRLGSFLSSGVKGGVRSERGAQAGILPAHPLEPTTKIT